MRGRRSVAVAVAGPPVAPGREPTGPVAIRGDRDLDRLPFAELGHPDLDLISPRPPGREPAGPVAIRGDRDLDRLPFAELGHQDLDLIADQLLALEQRVPN